MENKSNFRHVLEYDGENITSDDVWNKPVGEKIWENFSRSVWRNGTSAYGLPILYWQDTPKMNLSYLNGGSEISDGEDDTNAGGNGEGIPNNDSSQSIPTSDLKKYLFAGVFGVFILCALSIIIYYAKKLR